MYQKLYVKREVIKNNLKSANILCKNKHIDWIKLRIFNNKHISVNLDIFIRLLSSKLKNLFEINNRLIKNI